MLAVLERLGGILLPVLSIADRPAEFRRNVIGRRPARRGRSLRRLDRRGQQGLNGIERLAVGCDDPLHDIVDFGVVRRKSAIQASLVAGNPETPLGDYPQGKLPNHGSGGGDHPLGIIALLAQRPKATEHACKFGLYRIPLRGVVPAKPVAQIFRSSLQRDTLDFGEGASDLARPVIRDPRAEEARQINVARAIKKGRCLIRKVRPHETD
jgi:hypothetical protein